jgi:CubicO group peptidase (beta-lactamase class C family)
MQPWNFCRNPKFLKTSGFFIAQGTSSHQPSAIPGYSVISKQIRYMKKFLRRFLYLLLLLIIVFSGYAFISGKTWLFKEVAYNFADIDDYKIFSNNTVAVGQPQPWALARNFNKPVLPDTLKNLLQQIQSIGVTVIKNDSLLFEKYWDGYSDTSRSGSFSMAKSITSLLTGIALKEGKIKSIEERVGNYLPEFREGEKAKLRIVDLLTMSSGSNWDESYSNPFSVTAALYYSNDIYKVATGVQITRQPGTYHAYKSGDTQLLGLVLEKATGKSLSAYASEKLWQPMGAEHPALWSTDKEGGNEKAYCCFNSNARDFARIGQLMLDSGRWKGNEMITPGYYRKSIAPCMIPDDAGKPCDYYGFQWWLVPYEPGVFYARGILGQYIIVLPAQHIVIVRLGKHRSPKRIGTVPEEVDALIQWGKTL